jgi:K+-transporting ATPase ATPase B chain
MPAKARPLFDPEIVMPAIWSSFGKLNPFNMWKNPVMFVTEVGAAVTTVDFFLTQPEQKVFVAQITIWLWFTVLFANFAEAMA